MARNNIFHFRFYFLLVVLGLFLAGCTSIESANGPEPATTISPTNTPAQTLTPTQAAALLEVYKALDPAEGQLPEGITIDISGNVYISLGYPFWFPTEEGFGEIWKIQPDGETKVLASFPGGPAPAGMVVSPFKDIYFAYPNPMDPETNGVYELHEGQEPQRLPGSENIGLANGLVITPSNMYVSDSAAGAIWRIPRGGTAERWIQHEWLSGCDPENNPIGANGIAIWNVNTLYVASTARGLLLRIPVLPDGSPGEIEMVAGTNDCDPEFDGLDGMDGIILDRKNRVLALLVIQHQLVRINTDDGSFEVMLTAKDGLHNPASIAFGTGADFRSIYLTNFALLPPSSDATMGPGVLKFTPGAD